jgi:hypothetical protein
MSVSARTAKFHQNAFHRDLDTYINKNMVDYVATSRTHSMYILAIAPGSTTHSGELCYSWKTIFTPV